MFATPLVSGYVTLDWALLISEPHFLHLYNGGSHAHFKGTPEGVLHTQPKLGSGFLSLESL